MALLVRDAVADGVRARPVRAAALLADPDDLVPEASDVLARCFSQLNVSSVLLQSHHSIDQHSYLLYFRLECSPRRGSYHLPETIGQERGDYDGRQGREDGMR